MLLELFLDLIRYLFEWLRSSKIVLLVFPLFHFVTFAKGFVGFIYMVSSYAWKLNYYYVWVGRGFGFFKDGIWLFSKPVPFPYLFRLLSYRATILPSLTS